MYLKEITMEGFKSYAQRTVVPNFDPLFNAITGLNGSGKSNILDSICFVLGITNLQQVRAGSLQDLIYKQGQAGTTKATVSLVFDNRDKSRSPVGYEQFQEITVTRQIVIGGRNKYLIDGKVAQPGRVQNLFHSVQLNINNPHFLIMQGRITKVLNMKPPEILSMLEEASGTRMYENKKEAALKALEKKQTKVEEIDRIQSEEILPALDTLRKEKRAYMEWTTGNAEVDKLKRLVVAYDFTVAEKAKNSSLEEMNTMKLKAEELQALDVQMNREIEEHEASINVLISEKKSRVGDNVTSLAAKVNEMGNVLVKETAQYKNKKEMLEAEQESVRQLKTAFKDMEATIREKERALESAKAECISLDDKERDCAQRLCAAEAEHQNVLAGKTSGSGDEKSSAERLSEAKAAAAAAGSDAKQAKVKVQHFEKELAVKKKQLASMDKEVASTAKSLQAMEAEVLKYQAEVEELRFDPEQQGQLEQSKSVHVSHLRALKASFDELSCQTAGLDFYFKDPARGFDRTRVKGVVASLFNVRDPATTTALEVAAGGKMYNVVVDTEQTAKLLLEKGGLKRRVTLIPLSRIESRAISPQVESAAIQIGGRGNVQTALSLVQFDPELQRAMEFVFGGVFVCKDAKTAKAVCFDSRVRTPCVTLEGDFFSPSGTLSGGSRNKGGSILSRLHQLRSIEVDMTARRRSLEEVERSLSQMATSAKAHHQLSVQLELKRTELKHLQERAAQSQHHQLLEEVRSIETQLTEAQVAGAEADETKARLEEEAASLAKEMQEIGKERDKKLKALEAKVKAVKSELERATKALKAHKVVVERLEMERDAVVQEHANLAQQMSGGEVQNSGLENEVGVLEARVREMEKSISQLKEELAEKKAEVKACDKEIGALSKAVDKLKKKITDNDLEGKKLERALQKMESDREVSAGLVEKYLEKYKWIPAEQPHFGVPGTDYDFSAMDPREARRVLDVRQGEQASLEKRVNKKVLNMFEKAEQEYNDLLQKKNIVEKDKAKIQQVIRELDEKKKEQLRLTWTKVNKDFGSIFSTLLPGTMAKLEPPEGCDFLEGLEVKVAFGSVWKQSLSELSGGQRSLLALSLILALLLFKPAPLYILDEVDAALDLSHTQNIGRMIKAHFPQSQFIVVSLKEGMFNNANVIFRTKFVDGVSTVTRTLQGPRQEDHERGGKAHEKQANKRQREVLRDIGN